VLLANHATSGLASAKSRLEELHAGTRVTLQYLIYLLVISVKLKVFYKTVATTEGTYPAPWNTDDD
jgi:hypothetical protein